MDFSIPQLNWHEDVDTFRGVRPGRDRRPAPAGLVPAGRAAARIFQRLVGEAGGYGFELAEGRLVRRPALREALIAEALARLSPGAAIAALAHADLGMMGLCLFGAGVAAAPLRPGRAGRTDGHVPRQHRGTGPGATWPRVGIRAAAASRAAGA
ncbi:MAG: hypothetical protein MZV70_68105 [Desulfobacterales bacterium]|nr:hypothetical protein [Desulfobacterales bacterium]